MVEHGIEATQAIVTLDVPLPGIIWGWMITLNMWAKSIGTGVVLVGAFLLHRHKKEDMPNLRWMMPLISFIALNVFLFFTLIDLHQPLRMINIFLNPNWSSAITVGAWMASLFTGLITLMMAIGFLDQHPDFGRHIGIAKSIREKSDLYDKVFPFVVFLALPVTMYTAIIMAQSSARELWVGAPEMIQMLLAAFMVGSATLVLISEKWSPDVKKDLAMILAFSVAFSFTMYMGEYFFSFKAAEVEATLAFVHSGGEYNTQFWFAMVLGYIIPFVIAKGSMRDYNPTLMRLAAITTLIGLYMAKDVWLKIPQLLPLS
ncbi:polysulfide reductase [Sulfurovum sp. bin170]|uniref:NrfD/PsrC family molybdoenzyme membrane anchor subunit n=1 Tax=Sulfurovum sp. bin170 TaxID=2695268 RepID=UPI0013DFEAB8|nr:NrfD/PsrC family molybdoenzyme membrane anchor subunit [Sulfurovum sp. bin170]NEW59753.1 polysulfide reductase [Sulfurovum sp. bin170]